MFNIYFDFANAVKDRLMEDINGRISFKIYSQIDTVIFLINFKDFKFEFGLNDIQENLMTNNDYAREIAEKIKGKYRVAVLRAFFKSDERKERENRQRLGIYLEEV